MRKGGDTLLSLAALAVLSPDERGLVEDIYLKYEKKLYAKALGITGNRHDAEDAVENAVLGVIGNISHFAGKPDREIASQLYIYTKYAAIDIYRKRALRLKKEILPTGFPDDDGTTPEPPDDSPTKKPTMRLMMTKSDPPTAASAVLPTYCPRMTASTIEYSCWNTVPSMMGRKKRSIPRQTEPSVSDTACPFAVCIPFASFFRAYRSL